MEELLKELGYTDEQIKAITDGMINKKIYTSTEENADLRLKKLQEDFNGKEGELTKANELIKQLQNGNKDNEDLQTKVTDYENEIAQLKEEQHKKDVDNALKLALLKGKAKEDDIDYLLFKIKSKLKDGEDFKVDENGNLKDFDVEEIKKEFKNNFEDKANEKVDVRKLGGNDNPNAEKEEPATMLDALKERYLPKEDL